MQHQDKQPYWVQAGRTYCAVIEGRVEALVYWDESQPAYDELGEPLIAEAGWFWLTVDDPDNHQHLSDAPALRSDMSYDELVEATEQALDQARRVIVERFPNEAESDG